ncbi:Rho GDP-dissociation inhibitor 1 [Halotydeus destructor]|nr:Rho GDP-dissociation inhibitor 1 [Halotydeus destructor]
MADELQTEVEKLELDEDNPNYVPPPTKSLQEIVSADKDDESLRKYKETLLGQAVKDAVVVFPDDKRKAIVKGLALMVDGRDDMVLDLSGDLDQFKKKPFVIKEGVQYKIRIDFYVQREIVTGLKYVQKISRHGLQVEKMSQMIGSYPPKLEHHSFTSPAEDMPSGMLARGTYTVKSLFTDDDKNEHLKWEWSFELKKDWE